MGLIFEGPDQDSHLSRPNNHPWRRRNSHGATSTAPTATTPMGTILRYLQRLRRPGLQDRAGHLGSIDWKLQPNDSDVYQGSRPGLLSRQAGI